MGKAILTATLLCLSSVTGHADFRQEADRFLMDMPEDLQCDQSEAIRKAIDGDPSRLNRVRISRNKAIKLPDNVSVTDISDSLRLYKPTRQIPEDLPLLVYFHGGGWTIGSINSCARFCSSLAATGMAAVLAVEYPLAPEHPYPQGLESCINAVTTAFQKAGAWGCNGGISIGGDSSGGNLAIAASLKMNDAGIRSLILFYPVTKAYPDNSSSWEKYKAGYGLDSDLMMSFNEAYTSNPCDPLVSVGDAPESMLSSLPPLLLIAAERDILRDQGVEFIAKVRNAGVEATRIEIPEAAHLFITVPGQEKAFLASIEMAARFLNGQHVTNDTIHEF